MEGASASPGPHTANWARDCILRAQTQTRRRGGQGGGRRGPRAGPDPQSASAGPDPQTEESAGVMGFGVGFLTRSLRRSGMEDRHRVS